MPKNFSVSTRPGAPTHWALRPGRRRPLRGRRDALWGPGGGWCAREPIGIPRANGRNVGKMMGKWWENGDRNSDTICMSDLHITSYYSRTDFMIATLVRTAISLLWHGKNSSIHGANINQQASHLGVPHCRNSMGKMRENFGWLGILNDIKTKIVFLWVNNKIDIKRLNRQTPKVKRTLRYAFGEKIVVNLQTNNKHTS